MNLDHPYGYIEEQLMRCIIKQSRLHLTHLKCSSSSMPTSDSIRADHTNVTVQTKGKQMGATVPHVGSYAWRNFGLRQCNI